MRYFAFISYNTKDIEWGKKVQRKLEHYRMPATLCSEHGWIRRSLLWWPSRESGPSRTGAGAAGHDWRTTKYATEKVKSKTLLWFLYCPFNKFVEV